MNKLLLFLSLSFPVLTQTAFSQIHEECPVEMEGSCSNYKPTKGVETCLDMIDKDVPRIVYKNICIIDREFESMIKSDHSYQAE